MAKRRTIFDDGFQEYLTKDAILVGEPGIPMLMDLQNTEIPSGMIPFSKASRSDNKRQYIHFYMFDREFNCVLTSTQKYLNLMRQFDGVITPDCSMLIGQAPCLQQANTYMNRAVGYYLQRNGIPVIPNIRWSDESSFAYCFLGVPKHSIVCISTHGCINTAQQKAMFRIGLQAMIETLEPSAILVHGYMPEEIFGNFLLSCTFYRYPSQFELTHKKEVQ